MPSKNVNCCRYSESFRNTNQQNKIIKLLKSEFEGLKNGEISNAERILHHRRKKRKYAKSEALF